MYCGTVNGQIVFLGRSLSLVCDWFNRTIPWTGSAVTVYAPNGYVLSHCPEMSDLADAHASLLY